MMGTDNLRSGFYNEKFNIIDESVRNYAKVKSGDIPNLEDLNNIKQVTQTLLSKMMIESGIRNDENAFISLDNEFFDENGVFSDSKLGDFQKLMLQYYALNDIKWTFAGTTQSLTKLSKTIMEDEGIDRNELLPIEISRNHNKEEIRRLTGKTPDTTKVFIYPDNTISNQYIPKKTKIKFNSSEDKNSEVWKSNYDPNLTIKKSGWTAGFNSNDNWEYISNDNNNLNTTKTKVAAMNNISDDNSELPNVSCLYVPGSDDTLLIDPDNILIDGFEENFYSISGELYGSRVLDKKLTIDEIKNNLSKSGIEKLSGIVVKETNEEVTEYYKQNFDSFLDDKTKFYNSNDNEITEKIIELRKYIKENEISSNVIENYFELVKEGKTSEQIYNNLTNTNLDAEEDKYLNIFKNNNDMMKFVSSSAIFDSDDDKEAKDILINMNPPDEQSENISNSIQNILSNYDNLVKKTGVDKKTLIKSIYNNIINKNNNDEISDIKIIKEKKLGDFIENMGIKSNKTDIPSFVKIYKEDNDYYNIYKEEDQKKWNIHLVKNQDLSPESITKLNNTINSLKVPEDKKEFLSYTIQNTFEAFTEIRENTGMKPEELLQNIYKKIIEKKDDKVFDKKIIFEKKLTDLIIESKQKNTNKVKSNKKDILVKRSSMDIENLNLLNNNDIEVFAMKSINDFNWENEDDKYRVVDVLKKAKIPFGSSKDFTFGVSEILKKHKKKKNGTLFLNDLELFSKSIKREIKDLPEDIKTLTDNLMKNNLSYNKNLNLYNKKDLNKFNKENNDIFNNEKLDKILTKYEKVYNNRLNYIEDMPFVYKDNIEKEKSIPIENNNTDSPNTFMNLGWKMRREKNQELIFNLSNNSKKNVFENNEYETNQEYKKVLLNTETVISEATQEVEKIQLSYANPYIGIIKKRKELLKSTQKSDNDYPVKLLNEHSEDMKLRRINDNYFKDKQALARSQSHSTENSTDLGTENNSSNNNIVQSADEFIDLIKKEIDKSIF